MAISEDWPEKGELDEFIQETSKTANFGEDISVFISSTVVDLKDERQSVYNLIKKIGLKPIRMEDFYPSDSAPLDVCLKHVTQATIYLGIIGTRYGTPYQPTKSDERNGKSFTELEYECAKTHGIRRCVTLINEEEARVRPIDVDRGPNNELDNFRKKLETDCFIRYYTDLEDLRTIVYCGLLKLIKEIREEEKHQTNQHPDPNAPISISVIGTGEYYAHESIKIFGTSLDPCRQYVYLYLLKSDPETKTALQNDTLPPEDKMYAVFVYGERYLKIPVNQNDLTWWAKLDLSSLTPHVKDIQALTLCVTGSPIHTGQKLGAHAELSLTLHPPFTALLCSSPVIKQDETLFIRGQAMTSQPLIHFWMFSEYNDLITFQTVIQPDHTFELALTPEVTKQFLRGTQYYCVAQVPWDTRWGRVRIKYINRKKYIARIDNFGYSDMESAIGVGDQTRRAELRDTFTSLLDQTDDQYVKFIMNTTQ